MILSGGQHAPAPGPKSLKNAQINDQFVTSSLRANASMDKSHTLLPIARSIQPFPARLQKSSVQRVAEAPGVLPRLSRILHLINLPVQQPSVCLKTLVAKAHFRCLCKATQSCIPIFWEDSSILCVTRRMNSGHGSKT